MGMLENPERSGRNGTGTERNRNRNGTEVIDAQYGCGRQIICQLINVRKAHLASCTSHEDGTSIQQAV